MSLAPRIDRLDGKKNLIINGAMEFNQRGSSINLGSSNLYLMDRFFAAKSPVFTGTSTYARSTNVPTVSESNWGFASSLLLTNGTGASPGAVENYYIGYRMEGYDYSEIQGKAIALSFWVKSSIPGTYAISFANAAQNTNYVTSYTIVSANTWEKKTVKLNTTTSGTWGQGDGVGLQILWVLSAGSSLQTAQNQWNINGSQYCSFSGATNWAGTTAATFQMTGVQLFEIGSTTDDVDGVPFSRCGKNIANELRLCQRYCQKLSSNATNNQVVFTTLQVTSSTAAYGCIPLKATMRATPTSSASGVFSVLGNGSTSSGGGFTAASSYSNQDVAGVGTTGGSGYTTQGHASNLTCNSSTAYILFEAEL